MNIPLQSHRHFALADYALITGRRIKRCARVRRHQSEIFNSDSFPQLSRRQ